MSCPRRRRRIVHVVLSLTTISDFKHRITQPDVRFIALQKPAGHAVPRCPRIYKLLRDLRADVVQDGVTVRLFPSDDAKAMAQASWNLYTDAARARSLAQSARRKALSKFGVAAMVSSYDRLFVGPQRVESGRSVPGYSG